VFLEVIVSDILSVYVLCPIPNGFRDRAVSLCSTQCTVQTSTALPLGASDASR
jgi:hypothetical protein